LESFIRCIQEDTGFVGEARIKAVSFADDLMEFLRRYGERLFLSEKELKGSLMN